MGEFIGKPDNISQEMRHHAKILSHNLQGELRARKENEALSSLKKKENNELVVSNGIYKRHDAATLKLFPERDNEVQCYKDLPIEALKKLLRDELKAFIHVRLFDTPSIPSGKSIVDTNH